MSTPPDRSHLSYRLAFSAAVAGLMSILIGGAISFVRHGFDGTLAAWAVTAPLAFAVAFPTSFFVVPLVQAWIDRLFTGWSPAPGKRQ